MLETEHSHDPAAIHERLSKGPQLNYLREWVYGGIDGVVTTFAIVAGVVGANLSPVIVVILGLANLIGDGFSMAASAYSSATAERDNYDRLREIEANHIDKYPEGEMEETRQIFAAKGLAGEDLEHLVRTLSKDKENWIDIMMTEEYGMSRPQHPPVRIAVHTFLSFIACGAMPLVPFVFGFPQAPWIALVLSALTFFAIGSFKSIWSVKRWWREGGVTMIIGLTAAGLAFLIGFALKHLV